MWSKPTEIWRFPRFKASKRTDALKKPWMTSSTTLLSIQPKFLLKAYENVIVLGLICHSYIDFCWFDEAQHKRDWNSVRLLPQSCLLACLAVGQTRAVCPGNSEHFEIDECRISSCWRSPCFLDENLPPSLRRNRSNRSEVQKGSRKETDSSSSHPSLQKSANIRELHHSRSGKDNCWTLAAHHPISVAISQRSLLHGADFSRIFVQDLNVNRRNYNKPTTFYIDRPKEIIQSEFLPDESWEDDLQIELRQYCDDALYWVTIYGLLRNG